MPLQLPLKNALLLFLAEQRYLLDTYAAAVPCRLLPRTAHLRVDASLNLFLLSCLAVDFSRQIGAYSCLSYLE